MTMTCEQHYPSFVPYAREELGPLPKARLASHLQHCPKCASLYKRLSEGLTAARQWQPQLDSQHLERLVTRLAPYSRAPRRDPLRVAYAAGLMAAVALLVAVLALSWWWIGDEQKGPAVPSLSMDLDLARLDVEAELVHHQVTPYVRVLAPSTWDGAIRVDRQRTVIDMSRGFAAISFVGGSQRRLRVVTPAARLDVVGTRFFVAVDQDGGTALRVAEGRVRMHSGERITMVGAGEARRVNRAGETVPGEVSVHPALEDDFLVSHAARRARQDRAPAEVLGELERAEELLLAGRVDAALRIYQTCAGQRQTAYQAYRGLCRLQAARIIGFEQGKRAQARAMLGRLASGAPGEVSRQAALAMCELELKADRCQARRCLEGLSQGELAGEARQLIDRWGLEACE